MKLRNWHIDGFGVFSGVGLPEPGLGDGLNLVCGPNEAGKTTLLDFLRYTLFGYPSGHSRLPRREPLRGGNHCGTVTYEVDGLSFQLYREANNKRGFQLRDPNGTQLTDGALAGHLGHISSEIFRNILGFSLAELQDLKSLTEGDVRELIFAASIGQSAARIRNIEESLSKQGETIFRESTRPTAINAPRIVKLRYELDQREQQLEQATQASRTVADKLKDLEEKAMERGNVDGRLKEVRRDIQRLDRLISGWPLWVERYQAVKEINELGDVSGFPVDGDATWATHKTEFDKAKEQAQTRCDEVQTIREKLSHLPAEFSLLRLKNDAEDLATKRTVYDVAKQLAENANRKAREAQQSWNAISEQLGPAWPEEIIRSFDVSLLGEDDARRFAKQVRDSELGISEKRVVVANLMGDARILSRDCASKATQLEEAKQQGPLLEQQEIAQHRRRLGEFRAALRNRESLQNDFGRARDHLAQVNLYTSQREPVEHPVPAWLSAVLIVGGLSLVASAVGLFFAGERLAAGMSVAFGLVLIGLAVLLRLRATRDRRFDLPSPGVSDAQSRYATAENALQDHDNHWHTEAARAGLSWPANENELTVREGGISAEERRLDDERGLSSGLRELRNKKLARNNEFRKARRELDEAERVHSAALQEWVDFLHARLLPETIQIETAIAVFARVKEAREYLIEFDDHNSAAEEREGEAQAYIRELRSCLRQTNLPIDESPTKTLAQFEGLLQQIKEEDLQSRERRGFVRELHTARKNLRDAVSIARDARRRLKTFLNHLGVSNEEALKALSDRAKRYSEVTHVTNEKNTALATIFGQSGVSTELQQAWDSGTRPDWETEKSQRENDEHTLAAERDKTLQDEAALKLEINSQLESDEVARLGLEAEELREEIRKGIEEWEHLATALELLRRTREKFERENQSPALDEASRLFRSISGGRYERVFIPLDSTEADLTIVSQVPPPLSLRCLSRGTLEQLFLCIRLGYIQHYQKQQRVSLPLLLDDVGVNFDPERTARTFEVLAEYCRNGQQILFFTCHEELIRLLGPEDKVFNIRDFAFQTRRLDSMRRDIHIGDPSLAARSPK